MVIRAVLSVRSVSCVAAHSRSVVVSGFHWPSDAAHLVVVLILRVHAAGLTSKARGSWGIPNLHSWRESILQENTAVLSILIVLLLTADSRVGSGVILD